MKTIIALIICFILFHLLAYTQVPGYVGKRFAVVAEFGITPTFNKQYKDLDYFDRSSVNNYGINIMPGIGIDYTLGKIVTIGVVYKHISSHLPMGRYSISLPENEDDISHPVYFGDVDLSANFGSVYFKFYPFERKGSIAPVGKYHKIEFMFGKVNSKTGGFTETDFEDYIYNPDFDVRIDLTAFPLTSFEDLNYQNTNLLAFFIYSFGAETIISKKITVDYNMHIGMPLQGLLGGSFFSGFGDSNFSMGFYQDDYDYVSSQRIYNMLYLGFSVSIGYLAF